MPNGVSCAYTKNSDLGREGGHEGLLEYMETRYLLLGGLEG